MSLETKLNGFKKIKKSLINLAYAGVIGLALAGGVKEASAYSGGIGEPNDPYRIVTPQDLNDIGNHEEDWDKHFILVNDVNLAEYTCTQFKVIGKWLDWYNVSDNKPFIGIFDGNNHKIWNFTWSSIDQYGIGLFGYLGKGGQIKNLGMENVDVNAMGKLDVGGLVGNNEGGMITNCYVTGTVSGHSCVGGLVGANNLFTGTIINCYFRGSVSTDGLAGGLVGANWNAVIDKCFSSGTVAGAEAVGGLVGDTDGGSITNCYSTSRVSGIESVGGLLGVAAGHGAIINECYSTGSVDAEEWFGGLVGYVFDSTVNSSFWDIETSSQLTSAGGEPKTTAEMKTIDTFIDVGWDFVETWGIGEHQTYPYLKFAPAGDLNHDKKVDFVDLSILASHWLEGVE